MSEFIDFPESDMRPLGEVLGDLRDRTRDFVGSLTTEAGIVYQEQRSSQSSQEQSRPAHGPDSNCSASVCSACGRGGEQKKYHGRG